MPKIVKVGWQKTIRIAIIFNNIAYFFLGHPVYRMRYYCINLNFTPPIKWRSLVLGLFLITAATNG